MQEQIVKAIEEALKGTKQLEVTFKKESTPDLKYLIAMIRGNYVSMLRADQIKLAAAHATGRWSRDISRTMVITLTDTFDQELFVSRMGRHNVLERIEAFK